MKYEATSPDDYIRQLPPERQPVLEKLRAVIRQHLPEGFEETMNYGMIGYVVPHSLYPAGYHCNPKLPLPFISIASQKNFVALYHMGLYANAALMEYFKAGYAAADAGKLDMGKSCIRFKKLDRIPYELIGELCEKMSVADWIQTYESAVKR